LKQDPATASKRRGRRNKRIGPVMTDPARDAEAAPRSAHTLIAHPPVGSVGMASNTRSIQ
jgi:hypothetical protein